MEHPHRARVIVTRVEEDGTSDFEEQWVDAVIETDADGNPLFQGSSLRGTSDGHARVGPGSTLAA